MSVWARLLSSFRPRPAPAPAPARPAPAPRVSGNVVVPLPFDFDLIRRALGRGKLSQKQVDGINAILAATKGLHPTWRAYMLATTWWETGRTMQPVRETLAATDEAAVNRLERSWKAGRMPQVRTPYWRFDPEGKTWLGRGYVQLTHKKNYARAAKEIGIDLLGVPSLAMKPEHAARILVEGSKGGWFTGRKLSDFLPGDYVGARRIINGTDKAHEIAALAKTFEEALP